MQWAINPLLDFVSVKWFLDLPQDRDETDDQKVILSRFDGTFEHRCREFSHGTSVSKRGFFGIPLLSPLQFTFTDEGRGSCSPYVEAKNPAFG